jgi:hypothetical protein
MSKQSMVRRAAVIALAGWLWTTLSGSSGAAIVNYVLSNGTTSGSAIQVQVSLDDGAVAGQVQATLTVIDNPSVAGIGTGDLRGFFFNVANESLLSGLSVAGTHVTDSQIAANSVTNLGGSAVITPFGPFDVGVEIGTSGIGSDDIPTTTITISHNSVSLTNALFSATSPFLGVRVTSVSFPDSTDRGDSGKYVGPGNIDPVPDPNPDPEVPEPASVLVWAALGIACSARALRRKRAA